MGIVELGKKTRAVTTYKPSFTMRWITSRV